MADAARILAKVEALIDSLHGDQAAEIEAVRATFESFMAATLADHPEARSIFLDVRDATLERLSREAARAHHDPRAARRAANAQFHARRLFAEVGAALGLDETDPDGADREH